MSLGGQRSTYSAGVYPSPDQDPVCSVTKTWLGPSVSMERHQILETGADTRPWEVGYLPWVTGTFCMLLILATLYVYNRLRWFTFSRRKAMLGTHQLTLCLNCSPEWVNALTTRPANAAYEKHFLLTAGCRRCSYFHIYGTQRMWPRAHVPYSARVP